MTCIIDNDQNSEWSEIDVIFFFGKVDWLNWSGFVCCIVISENEKNAVGKLGIVGNVLQKVIKVLCKYVKMEKINCFFALGMGMSFFDKNEN